MQYLRQICQQHGQQIWHVVQIILWVNGIIGVWQRMTGILKACRKFLSSVKEAADLGVALILFVMAMIRSFVLAMTRSPQKLTEPLLSPFALRLTYILLIAAILFGLTIASNRRQLST